MLLERLIIQQEISIFEALKKLDQSAISLVVVCQGDEVQGVLTDGDVRRALLKGADLQTPVSSYITRNFTSVFPEESRADVLELMQARVLRQVPIVDEMGRLRGIHTLHSILGREEKPNWAVIMAGGRGTRLGKLTEGTPKPMLKVAGKPILERLVLHLLSHGIRTIYLSVNYRAEVIEEYFGDGSMWGCAIMYLREPEPLGSGGALSLLPFEPKDPVIVMNGDLLMDGDLSKLIRLHSAGEYYASIGTHFYSHEVPFGCLKVDDNQIIELEEKPLVTKTINAGVYLLSREAIARIPRGTFFPITDLFKEALWKGLRCGAFDLDGDWIDVGYPEQLDLARRGQ